MAIVEVNNGVTIPHNLGLPFFQLAKVQTPITGKTKYKLVTWHRPHKGKKPASGLSVPPRRIPQSTYGHGATPQFGGTTNWLYHQFLAHYWKTTLTAAQRNTFATQAPSSPFTNSKGILRTSSGFGLFMHMNLIDRNWDVQDGIPPGQFPAPNWTNIATPLSELDPQWIISTNRERYSDILTITIAWLSTWPEFFMLYAGPWNQHSGPTYSLPYKFKGRFAASPNPFTQSILPTWNLNFIGKPGAIMTIGARAGADVSHFAFSALTTLTFQAVN